MVFLEFPRHLAPKKKQVPMFRILGHWNHIENMAMHREVLKLGPRVRRSVAEIICASKWNSHGQWILGQVFAGTWEQTSMLGGFVLSSASETAPKMELRWLKYVKPLPTKRATLGICRAKTSFIHTQLVPTLGTNQDKWGYRKIQSKIRNQLESQHQMPIASSGFQKLF